MENPLFLHALVLGLLLAISFFFYRYPPKKINWFYGYRTPTAMQSQQTWHFANHYSAKWMLRLVLMNALLGIGAMLVLDHKIFVEVFEYLVLLLVVSLLGVMAATEWLLYQRFRKKHS